MSTTERRRFTAAGTPTPEAIAEEQELQAMFPGYQGVDPGYIHAGKAALENWWDWKFGLRIHWSLYSIPGNGPESWPLARGPFATPQFRAQYEELHKGWYPARFDAGEWCDMMRRAGMKFFTFTTKHHDGFSLYDTQTRIKKRRVHVGADAGKIVDCDLRYSIMETPFRRDIVRELVDAGRQRELGIGLYYSHIDWFDSDFRFDQWNYQGDPSYTRKSDPAGFGRMIQRHRQQVRELCTHYGKLDMFSFDMWFPDGSGVFPDLVETVKMARQLQPEMLIRHRGIGAYGDYLTPERTVPDNPDATIDGCPPTDGSKPRFEKKPWKVIYPGSKHFSHVWDDEYAPASWIVESLVDVVAKGGNFQLGYGPGPDGAWAPEIIHRLDEIGAWLGIYGEAIYGTRPYRVAKEGSNLRFTRSKDGKYVYVFVLRWPEAPFSGGPLKIASVRARPGSAVTMPGLDHAFTYAQDEKALTIDIPEWFKDPAKRPTSLVQVFRVETERP